MHVVNASQAPLNPIKVKVPKEKKAPVAEKKPVEKTARKQRPKKEYVKKVLAEEDKADEKDYYRVWGTTKKPVKDFVKVTLTEEGQAEQFSQMMKQMEAFKAKQAPLVPLVLKPKPKKVEDDTASTTTAATEQEQPSEESQKKEAPKYKVHTQKKSMKKWRKVQITYSLNVKTGQYEPSYQKMGSKKTDRVSNQANDKAQH